VEPSDLGSSSSEHKSALRPLWQRLGVVTGEGLIGSYLAMMIIVGRSRIIRRLWILPPASVSSMATDMSIRKAGGDKHVFFQSIHHFDSQGQLYPYKSCKLDTATTQTQGREMLLKVDGIRGFYSLSLEGAKINGQDQTTTGRGAPVSLDWARQELRDAWRAEGGARRKFRPKFTSGPVVSEP